MAKTEGPSFRGPNFLADWFVYDYEKCDTGRDLRKCINEINRRGYDLVSVTQDRTGIYTVFFRGRACG